MTIEMTIFVAVTLVVLGAVAVTLMLIHRKQRVLDRQNEQILHNAIKPIGLAPEEVSRRDENELQRKINSFRTLGRFKRYQPRMLGSTCMTTNMLIRQFQFPLECCEADSTTGRDTDRIILQDFERAQGCLKRHGVLGEGAIGDWSRRATDEAVINFLVDFIPADQNIVWTGYQISGSVDKSNGGVIYHLRLFAKHPESSTEVYTGQNAPNVI